MGTIPDRCGFQTSPAVHPHGRGDNNRYADRMYGAYGSPPRAWGQCSSSFEKGWEWRFTPTGVGTIGADILAFARKTVHPHGRGDNTLSAMAAASADGSPPRAWGHCAPIAPPARPKRFTPTGVGTIDSAPGGGAISTVHSHGRGDNVTPAPSATWTPGSPPRAWGQFAVVPDVPAGMRFTPTGVGTIAGAARRRRRIAVHPHGRGDNAPP